MTSQLSKLMEWFKTLELNISRMKHDFFFFPEVALYLYKGTIRPSLENSSHAWAGASSCYLDILDKLKKRVCRTVASPLAVSLESCAYPREIAEAFSIGVPLLDVYLKWLDWFHVTILVTGPLVILIGCMIIMSPFLDVTRMSMSTDILSSHK